MKKIIKNGLMALSASLLLLAASGTAHAVITAGGATIHNAATLTFTGGSSTASVNVAVNTIASAPTITVDFSAQSVNGGQAATYVYTIKNNANGSDTFSFTATSANAGVNGVPGINVNNTGTSATNLTLGGSIVSATNTVANTILIPAGSETNLAVNDKIRIGGTLYTIGGITPGTIATTAGNVTTAETPTTITVTGTIAVGAIGPGTTVGEEQTFSIIVTANTPAVLGVNGTHTVKLSGQTNATTQGATPAVVTYATSAGFNETITTVLSSKITLVKEVRNVTQGVLTFAANGVTAKSGDTLEYRLIATNTSLTTNSSSSLLKDEVPPFTTYVAGSTTLNGNPVIDGTTPAGSLKLSAANGGLPVNSAGLGAGIIGANSQTATVLFKVTVD